MSNPWEIKTIEYDKTNSEGNVDTTGYGQISILLSKYVLKEKGKGLSSNDFTNSDKLKLDSVESGAQENKVETLTVNQGQKIYPNSDKNIDITVPTRVSQLANDLGYAKLANMSTHEDYSDSYVGKAKIAFQDEENIAIGKNANANEGGIAIGVNTTTNEIYDVNINNQLLHNQETNVWEGKISESEVANKNSNGTDLTQLDTVIDNLASEVQNRIDGDTTLQNNIDDEIQNRIDGDTTLQNNIDDEIQNRIDGDDLLTINLNAEVQNRTNADNGLSNRITSIDNLIPNQASSENQLADKSFVNSTIQTNTANFRGNWNNWSDVPTDENDYPQDYSGSKIPTVNDYLVVQNASDYTLETLNGTWRFKYVGNWETDGKNGWIPEYQVNEEPFTSEQLYAINSGITSNKVSSYDSHLTDTNNPHSVTKAQVGLGNCDNTADADKSVLSASKLTTARSLKVALDSTTAVTFDGSADQNSIPVSGTLGASNGGTGKTTLVDSANALINALSTSDSTPSENDYYVSQYANGGTTATTYHRRPVKALRNYIETSGWYGTCSTASATVAKTVSITDFVLTTNVRVTIKFTNANTATNATLNINSTGAKEIYYHGTNVPNNIMVANTTLNLVYNGTQYEIIGDLDTTGSSSLVTGVKGEAESTYRTGDVNITKSNLGLTTDEMGMKWNDSNILTDSYNSPYYANGIWVIGGNGVGIKYSLDGKTWNDSNITSGTYNSPYYANGIWVIGGAGIKYSLDGKTWNDSNITSGSYFAPYYANGIWVISGNGVGIGIKYSLDGKTWSNSNITSGTYNSPYYANGIWVISNAGIKYSLDGKTWSNSNITNGSYYQPYYANGIWVIGGTAGIKYSLDGKTWTNSNITRGFYGHPYYANGIWVINSSNNTGIKYSTFNSLDDLGSAFKGITELSEKTTNLIEKTSSATIYYGTCSTSRATNAKVVTCPTFKLEIGCKIIVKFTDTAGSVPSSGNISLNINGTGTINLYNKNYTQMTYAHSGEFRANKLCEITYDGTYYIWLNSNGTVTNHTLYL
jgi:hypothetical protein